MNSIFHNIRLIPSWLAIGLLYLLVKTLPWKLQLTLGRGIGRLLLRLVPRRREIAKINLAIAFPDRSKPEQEQLLRAHFEAIGMGLFELGFGWWGAEKTLKKIGSIEGLEHLDNAVALGKGVILVSAHFTTLEITGHILGLERPLHVLYRRNENPVFERYLKSGRERHAVGTIHRDDIRGMIRLLKQGHTVWFAFDQNYGGKGHVFSPFFGQLAATNTATSRLAKITGAAVVPFFAVRKNNGTYALTIQPALENFPSKSEEDDTNQLNMKIEEAVKLAPEQYLWVHRRYKQQPNKDFPVSYPIRVNARARKRGL